MRRGTIRWILISALVAGGAIGWGSRVEAEFSNSWVTTTSGKWETGGNWSLGAPNIFDAQVLITNTSTSGKTITLDSSTVSSAPGSLTISNLFLSGPASTQKNSLSLTNMGVTPLDILSVLQVFTNASVTISNSTLRADGFAAGVSVFNDGDILLNSGAFIASNRTVEIGLFAPATMTVSNGHFLAGSLEMGETSGSRGVLTVSGGGSAEFSSSLEIGRSTSATGAVWITGGQLLATNDLTYVGYGFGSVGQVTISNGTWTAEGVQLAESSSSVGTITFAGGTTTFGGFEMAIGIDASGATGTVWMTGGQLNTSVNVGNFGIGIMTISNGVWQGDDIEVDSGGTEDLVPKGGGTLTIAGGSISMSFGLNIGSQSGTTGTVWMTGGQEVNGFETTIGETGFGRMTVSNGTWQSPFVHIPEFGGAVGVLTIAGGTNSAYTKLTMGTADCTGTGIVTITGGSLFVTNGGSAILDLENGTFTLNGGLVVVDTFVMTNPCAHFVRTGGTLLYNSAVLDPTADVDGDGIPSGYEQSHGLDPLNPADGSADNDGDGFNNLQEFLAGTNPNSALSTPFRMTSIARQGNNVVLTWTTSGGTTNQVQATHGTANGSYTTNGFANLGAQLVIAGSGLVTTNFTDVGGATNRPSRFYRVRLVP